MVRKNIFLILALILMAMTIFTGCWDKIELEEEGYVAAIGVDQGKGDSVNVTFQITNPKTGGNVTTGTSSRGEPKDDTITMECEGILVARDLVSATVSRRVSLSHSKIVIVGEKFARTNKFFHLIESGLRDKEMRRSMTIMVSREDASQFIRNNNPVLEERPQKFYEFMSKRWKDTGFVPPLSNLNRFMQRTEQGESLFLITYGTTKDLVDKEPEEAQNFLPGQLRKESGNPTEIIGAAVFKDGRMVGRLTGEEVRIASLLRRKPEVRNMLMSFKDPLNKGNFIATRITKQKKTVVKVNIKGVHPKIDVTVPISIDVLGIMGFTDYPESMENQQILKNSIEDCLQEKALNLIKKTKNEFEGEPFLWELTARGKFLTYDAYESYEWMKKYKEAEVTVKFNVNIREFGKQLNPPDKGYKNK